MVLDVDKKYLKEHQYKSSGNLEARIAIHQKFRTNPESFHKWIWNNLKIDKSMGTFQPHARFSREYSVQFKAI